MFFAAASCNKDGKGVDIQNDTIQKEDLDPTTWVWETDEIAYNYDVADLSSNEIDKKFADGLNYFAIKMFKDIYEENNEQNVIISPFSINVAIGMLYNGGDKNIRDSIKLALKLDGMSDEDINRNFKLLFDSYRGFDEKVDIVVANSAWFDEKVSINEEFNQKLSENFYADIFSIELVRASRVIGSWVEFYTKGLIENYEDDLDINSNTALVLINTLCFNGDWTFQFDVEDTKPRNFYNKSGNYVKTDFMYTRGLDLEYYFADSINAVRLPYGREKIAMYLFIDDNENADNITKWFNPLEWETMSNGFEKYPEEFMEYWQGIYLPKFSLDFSVNLPDLLPIWGIPTYNYNKLCSSPIAIVKANHRCVISINETGTEAAAVTGFQGVWGGPPTEIYFNRPFYFMIVDERNGIILFQGIVNKFD